MNRRKNPPKGVLLAVALLLTIAFLLLKSSHDFKGSGTESGCGARWKGVTQFLEPERAGYRQEITNPLTPRWTASTCGCGHLIRNRTQLKSSRRFSNPPEHLGDDFPFLFAAESNRLVAGILRLQHNGVVKLLQAGNRQSLVAMPGDHYFPV